MTKEQGKSLFKSYSNLFLDFDNLSFNFDRGWDNLITELCRTLDLYMSIYPKSDLSSFKIVSLGNLYCSTKWLHWSAKKVLCQNHAIELYYYSLKS